MDFMEAVKEMEKGKKVRRTNWNNKTLCLFFDGISFKYFNKNDDSGSWSFDVLSDFESVDWEVVKPINPAHICMNCDKHLGFRGFCSKKCHDEWYDKEYGEIEDKKSLSDKECNIITEKVQVGKPLESEVGWSSGYFKSDVKEFIKTIKQKIYGLTSNSPEILAMIDKEAGKQLTQH